MGNISNMTFFRFYENFLELFKSELLFHDLRMTRKTCSRRSWKNYKYIYCMLDQNILCPGLKANM